MTAASEAFAEIERLTSHAAKYVRTQNVAATVQQLRAALRLAEEMRLGADEEVPRVDTEVRWLCIPWLSTTKKHAFIGDSFSAVCVSVKRFYRSEWHEREIHEKARCKNCEKGLRLR